MVANVVIAGAGIGGLTLAVALQRRVTRANGVVRASRRFGAIAQWSNPVAAWIRDRVVSLTPASVAINQAKRLMETYHEGHEA